MVRLLHFLSSACYNATNQVGNRGGKMEAKELLLHSLEQSQGFLDKALDGLTQKEAEWSPTQESNSIAFILWHTFRVEDFFINRVVKREKDIYEIDGWKEKLGTPDKVYQYTVEELKDWKAPELKTLVAYSKAVRKKTMEFLQAISNEKLDEVPRPERSPDSIGVTVGHIVTEIALHVGQIAYLRGVQRGLDK